MPSNLRVHALMHVPFEGLGRIKPWLEKQGCSLSETHLYRDDPIPAVADFDWLIVMGGPMSVHDGHDYPWLNPEKSLIRAAIAADKALLGICLGAQLIVEAAGGEVVAGEPEIGWWPLFVSPDSEDDRFGFAQLTAFHWHGEQIQLPPAAVRLASSAGCLNQAFQLGERIIGLQFHLETTPESARLLVEHAAEDLQSARFVQNADRLLQAEHNDYQALAAPLEKLLSYLARCPDPTQPAIR